MKPTRIDRNFLRNAQSFNESIQEGKDRLLMKRLVGLTAFAFQYPVLTETVFGDKVLDATMVANIFGYNKNYLNTAHPNPQQLVDKDQAEIEQIEEKDKLAGLLKLGGEPRWYTNLDNALYCLYYISIPYTKGSQRVTLNQTDQVSEVKALKLFQDLRKIYTHKTRKSVYEYKEDPNFVRSLANYYLWMDFGVFRKLNLVEIDAYFDLIQKRALERYNFRNMTKNHKAYPTVTVAGNIDEIAARWNIQKNDGASGKSKFTLERNAINQIVESINAKAGYDFCNLSWSKASSSSRFPGQPVFEFPFPKSEQEAEEGDFRNKLSTFTIFFLKERFREFSRKEFLSMEDFNKQFINYLHHEQIDVEGKQKSANEAYKLVGRRDLDPPEYAAIPKYIKIYINQAMEKPKPVELN